MLPAVDRARQEQRLVTISICLGAASAICMLVSVFKGDKDNATWWLTLGGAISSVAVVIFASSQMASIIARGARHAQILDEVAREVTQNATILLSAGHQRLKDEAASDVAHAASDLTKSVDLLGKCSPDQTVYLQIRKAALEMKRALTDSLVDARRLNHAAGRNLRIKHLLLRLRMTA